MRNLMRALPDVALGTTVVWPITSHRTLDNPVTGLV